MEGIRPTRSVLGRGAEQDHCDGTLHPAQRGRRVGATTVAQPVRRSSPRRNWRLGDHLRRRCLTLKLTQREVATQIGADGSSIHNWEASISKPSLAYMPAILQFLGYNPVPPGDGWGERLVQSRTGLGLSQKDAARQIGVDQGTLARWERGEREPAGVFAERATRFLNNAAVSTSTDDARTA